MPPRAAAILTEVGVRHGLTAPELLERRQYRELTAARRECARLLKRDLAWSSARIGRLFGMTEAAIRYYLD
jgi:chromosomal replication initiation ATPase DnaA